MLQVDATALKKLRTGLPSRRQTWYATKVALSRYPACLRVLDQWRRGEIVT